MKRKKNQPASRPPLSREIKHIAPMACRKHGKFKCKCDSEEPFYAAGHKQMTNHLRRNNPEIKKNSIKNWRELLPYVEMLEDADEKEISSQDWSIPLQDAMDLGYTSCVVSIAHISIHMICLMHEDAMCTCCLHTMIQCKLLTHAVDVILQECAKSDIIQSANRAKGYMDSKKQLLTELLKAAEDYMGDAAAFQANLTTTYLQSVKTDDAVIRDLIDGVPKSISPMYPAIPKTKEASNKCYVT